MNIPDFNHGLVFGFDVGTGSIGYAVRHGAEFLDIGVMICPEETADLSGRRGLRSGRRRLRNRSRYRHWFANQLELLGLQSPFVKIENEQEGNKEIRLRPGLDIKRISNPALLRYEAILGVELTWPAYAQRVHNATWNTEGRSVPPAED